jgi:hypothetical protein
MLEKMIEADSIARPVECRGASDGVEAILGR